MPQLQAHVSQRVIESMRQETAGRKYNLTLMDIQGDAKQVLRLPPATIVQASSLYPHASIASEPGARVSDPPWRGDGRSISTATVKERGWLSCGARC